MTSLFTFGTHCALQSCHQLDYLPFKCDRCNLQHCLNHRQPADHQCTSLHQDKDLHSVNATISAMSIAPKSNFQHFRCSHESCKKRELTSNECKNCTLNFCLSHRFPHQHSCKAKPQLQPGLQPSDKLSQLSQMQALVTASCATQSRTQDRKRINTNIASQSRLLRSH